MVYGQPLFVPDEFIPQLPSATSYESARLQSARWSVRQFTPCHPTRHNQKDTYIPNELLFYQARFIEATTLTTSQRTSLKYLLNSITKTLNGSKRRDIVGSSETGLCGT